MPGGACDGTDGCLCLSLCPLELPATHCRPLWFSPQLPACSAPPLLCGECPPSLTPTTYPEALAGRTRFRRWGRAGRGWNGSRQPPAAGHRASWPAGGQKSPLQQVGCRPLGGDRTHCGRAQVHTCPPALVPPGLTPYLSQKGSRCICSDRSPVQASSGWESGWPPGLQGQSAETEPPDYGTGDMADLRRGSS